MIRTSNRTAALAAILIAAATELLPAPAGAQPPPAADLDACARIESAVTRLDCYDELARRRVPASADSARADPTAPPREESRAERNAVAAAAAPLPQQTSRPSRRDERRSDREVREFLDRVVSLREIQPGRLEITLASGQVWRQTNSQRYNLLPGHEVRLYPSAFGQSYRLTALELRSFIQVERVR